MMQRWAAFDPNQTFKALPVGQRGSAGTGSGVNVIRPAGGGHWRMKPSSGKDGVSRGSADQLQRQ